MDTSETYIKMWLASGLEIEPDDFQPWICPNCYEIFTPFDIERMTSGNWHWCPDQEKRYIHVDLKPLARQDQLQGMVESINIYSDVPRFAEFVRGGVFEDKKTTYYATWEQLWLAFVMWELHSKRWDGEKWTR